ncbi:MAG: PHP domain-containing protein [Phycisphaerae bacterium]
MRINAVLHAHTDYSHDSPVSPGELIDACRRDGIGCISITDHDEIRGALEVADCRDVRVIVGEEVSTRAGHLIGLFLSEWIPPGLSALETAERIHAQGGVVLAPHPYLRFPGRGLCEALDELAPHIDALEVCNAQDPFPWSAWAAARFAKRHGLARYVGADVHLPASLRTCYQVMPAFTGPRDFVAALQQAELRPGRFGVGYGLTMAYVALHERLVGRPAAGYGRNWRRLRAPRPAAACANTE